MRVGLVWLSVFFVVAGLTGRSALAQVRDSAKQVELRRLFKATQVEDRGRQLMDKVLATMGDRMSPADLKDLKAAMEKEVRYDELVDSLLDVYDAHFSREEIQGLVAFFESPLGKKFVHDTPVVDREADEVVKQWANAVSARVLRRFVAARKARGGAGSERMPASGAKSE